MANTENFQEESLAECVQFCMEAAPNLNHVLISYYNALIVGDKVEPTTTTFCQAVREAEAAAAGNSGRAQSLPQLR